MGHHSKFASTKKKKYGNKTIDKSPFLSYMSIRIISGQWLIWQNFVVRCHVVLIESSTNDNLAEIIICISMIYHVMRPEIWHPRHPWDGEMAFISDCGHQCMYSECNALRNVLSIVNCGVVLYMQTHTHYKREHELCHHSLSLKQITTACFLGMMLVIIV